MMRSSWLLPASLFQALTTAAQQPSLAHVGWLPVFLDSLDVAPPRLDLGDDAATWTNLDSLTPPVTSFGTAMSANGTIAVVMGGFPGSAIGGVYNGTSALDVSVGSDPEEANSSWTTLQDMSITRQGFSASLAPLVGPDVVLAIGGFIGNYIVDGVTYNNLTAKVDALDLTTGLWLDSSTVPDYPHALTGVGAARLPESLGGQLVVVGGFGYEADGMFYYTNETHLLVEATDTATNTDTDTTDTAANTNTAWMAGPAFPWHRSGLSCATTSKGVLCFGGGETDPAYAEAALFDGVEWTVVAPMKEPRNWFGAATVMVPNDNATTLPTSKSKSAAAAAAAVATTAAGKGSRETSAATTKEVVYAVGGYCCKGLCFFSPLASVERYDVEAGVWEEATPLPFEHAAGGAAAGGEGRLVSLGGSNLGDVLVAVDP